MKKLTTLLAAAMLALGAWAQGPEKILFDDDWTFAFGDASSPAKDFGCGTEYFTYMTKAASIHNEGPYSPKFDASKWGKEWTPVTLPHDWVVDLPFAEEASHSHGYKTVGYKYPETSVGWYRKTFDIPAEDLGRHISLQFDGIFRNAQVWVNGFFLGNEPSGYATQVYDISEYLNYGGENVVAVRCDASMEEGWFYEGAGIYRHVWLKKNDPVHVDDYGTFAYVTSLAPPFDSATLALETTVVNSGNTPQTYALEHYLMNPRGKVIVHSFERGHRLLPKDKNETVSIFEIDNPMLWDLDNPNQYQILTNVIVNDTVVDAYTTTTGIRRVDFDPDLGVLLNGKMVKLKGVNMHQDHPGVGSAIPDALQLYRIRKLKELGVNAYRSSHNPMTEQMLEVCDSLGILVIDENRLTGVNQYHVDRLANMIKRDRNHPSVILYSVGNEEWGIEWNDFGSRIVESMREYAHRLDPTRKMTVASSSGPTVLVPADVAGYNYIMQNPVEQHRADYPERCAVGTEETSGCGTRGIYFDDDNDGGRMASLNRKPDHHDGSLNVIERGWKFYNDRPWLGGLFYWTGFDYRGEPNPMKFPATGSQFGILDYCGFPKDEAYYLQSWWTDEPVLHILPHWNLKGHEGDTISVWAYSNCDEVELIVNGKNLGRQAMPKDGHLEWTAVYAPGNVKAIGYNKGKKVLERKIETTGAAAKLGIDIDRTAILGDTRDLAVCDITLYDDKGRFVPDACDNLTVTVSGPVKILGVGNGDPAWQAKERPTTADEQREFPVAAFNGHAQVLVQSLGLSGIATVTIQGPGIAPQTASINVLPLE